MRAFSTRLCASLSRTMSGTSRMRAIRSPARTRVPGSTWSSSTMPETRGLIATSRRGTTEPVETAFLMMSARCSDSVS